MYSLIHNLLGASRLRPGAGRRTLLRTSVRGGLLRLNGAALVYGEGFLGSKNQRSLPLERIEALTIEPAPAAMGGVGLHIAIAGEPPLRLAGVSPQAAQRLLRLFSILRRL